MDLAVLSFIVYYDLELVLECLGIHYELGSFVPALSLSHGHFAGTVLLSATAPWAMRVGARALSLGDRVAIRTPGPSELPRLRLNRHRSLVFYLAIAILVTPIVAFGLHEVYVARSLFQARSAIGARLGPAVLVLYIPLFVFVFYRQLDSSRGPKGRLVALCLALAAMAAALPIGERSLLLLPPALLVISAPTSVRQRRTALKASVVLGAIIIVSTGLLSTFKFQYAYGSRRSAPNLLRATVSADFARAPILGEALSKSAPIGTKILPHAGSGYFYSLLFFVPRSLAPYKGYSTATYFTAEATGTPPSDTGFVYGLGVVEELSLNFGIIAILPGMFVVGLTLRSLEEVRRRHPIIGLPASLGSLLICGYDFPALLLLAGTMTAAVALLYWLFGEHNNTRQASPRRLWTPSV